MLRRAGEPVVYAGSMDDEKDRDERISLKPLTGEEALRALLQVAPDSEPAEPKESDEKRTEHPSQHDG